jgi:hypothetical protein
LAIDLFSTPMGCILFFVCAVAISSWASNEGSVAGHVQRVPENDGVTIGPATVATDTTEFELPRPFGPLGMD